MISISSQDRVAVAGGTLDGAGANLNGIAAVDSSRVNIDKVTILNAGRSDPAGRDRYGDRGFRLEHRALRHLRSGLNDIVVREIIQAIVVDVAQGRPELRGRAPYIKCEAVHIH